MKRGRHLFLMEEVPAPHFVCDFQSETIPLWFFFVLSLIIIIAFAAGMG
jgi:hypothetical protein